MTYGKLEPTNADDPDVTQMRTFTSRFGKYIPVGSHLVDNWPILKYVPFVTAELRRWHQEELGFFRGMVDEVRAKMVSACV